MNIDSCNNLLLSGTISAMNNSIVILGDGGTRGGITLLSSLPMLMDSSGHFSGGFYFLNNANLHFTGNISAISNFLSTASTGTARGGDKEWWDRVLTNTPPNPAGFHFDTCHFASIAALAAFNTISGTAAGGFRGGYFGPFFFLISC